VLTPMLPGTNRVNSYGAAQFRRCACLNSSLRNLCVLCASAVIGLAKSSPRRRKERRGCAENRIPESNRYFRL
jgi:hypothetical protein